MIKETYLAVINKAAALRVLGNNEALLQEVLSLLLQDIGMARTNFQRAIQQHDWQAVAAEAHKLTGGARYCGTERLAKACETLEKAIYADNANDTDILQLIAQVQLEMAAAERAIQPSA